MEQITRNNFRPNQLRTSRVAKLLGVRLNEPFRIQFFTHKEPYNLWHKLTDQGLMYSSRINGTYSHSDALEGLIIGKHQVVL